QEAAEAARIATARLTLLRGLRGAAGSRSGSSGAGLAAAAASAASGARAGAAASRAAAAGVVEMERRGLCSHALHRVRIERVDDGRNPRRIAHREEDVVELGAVEDGVEIVRADPSVDVIVE